MNFSVLRNAVAKQFQSMTATGLYRVVVDADLLWQMLRSKSCKKWLLNCSRNRATGSKE